MLRMTDGHTERLESALDGKYRIERKLGEGGMASVYLAEDIKHERKVALKILRPELAAILGAERFLSEIKTTANLQHPHILPLFDSGEASGYLYYVMPFIDGETLREKLEREQQLGIDEAVRIAREVADALDYAHRPRRHSPGHQAGQHPTARRPTRPGVLGKNPHQDVLSARSLASERVGPTGKVIGVDMTHEMIDKARANASKGSFDNVEFRLGEIEALPVADDSVDVIISNCVINLSENKDRVLAEAWRVLKPGGKVVISDMVLDQPVPAVLEGNLDAVAAGLPTFKDTYLQQFRDAGFADVHITAEKQYPSEHVLADAGVQDYLSEHPAELDELTAFAGSIAGAHFEATKVVADAPAPCC